MGAASRSGGGSPPLGALDGFRLLAAFLVVAIHTSPLASVNLTADFVLTRILARVAVPFFFLCSGFFLLPPYLTGKRTSRLSAPAAPLRRFLGKTLGLYGLAVIIYLPVNIYAGQLQELGLAGLLRLLLAEGSFYHLWYFPALIIGILLLLLLSRAMPYGAVLAVSFLLYLMGLGGDSYYGLSSRVPALAGAYQLIFSCFSYTRNGLFMAPLFLALGAGLGAYTRAGRSLPRRCRGWGLGLSLAALLGEGLLLHELGWQRHDSMYVMLPLCLLCLMALLLSRPRAAHVRWRRLSTWVYLLHPLCIIGVRGVAGLLGLDSLLVENSLVHYGAVCLSSLALAYVITLPSPGGRPETKQGRAWIELDAAALRHNVKALQALLPPGCALMPVLKANAYGHGALLLARQLQAMGLRAFAVATAWEGRELRRGGIKGTILVLGCTREADLHLLRRYGLSQTVTDCDYAQALDAWAAACHGWADWRGLLPGCRKLRVQLAIDSGMRRLGQRSEDIEEMSRVFACPRLRVEAAFTHFCTGGDSCRAAADFTPVQEDRFRQALERLQARGCHIPRIHSMSSCTVLHYPQAGGDYARVGLALYGAVAPQASSGPALRPVLSLKARVAQVKPIYAGEGAGYGLSYVAPHDGRLAVLSIGYGDGLPRCLSQGGGQVLLRGRYAPIVAHICMDMTLVDVSGIDEVQAGDIAVIIGSDNGLEITACRLAQQAHTISNEILSRLGARLPRILI